MPGLQLLTAPKQLLSRAAVTALGHTTHIPLTASADTGPLALSPLLLAPDRPGPLLCLWQPHAQPSSLPCVPCPAPPATTRSAEAGGQPLLPRATHQQDWPPRCAQTLGICSLPVTTKDSQGPDSQALAPQAVLWYPVATPGDTQWTELTVQCLGQMQC